MKFQEFKNLINKPYFTQMDIVLKKAEVFNYQLSLWGKKGYITKLKRGFYVFNDGKNELSAEEVGFLLYEPSYISLEYALDRHGFIPEAVFGITCVTPKITRKFSNEFGNFSYQKIRSSLFFGYDPIPTRHGKYLLAQPEKALLDFFYFNLGKINGEEDIESYRFNYDEIKKTLKKEKLDDYLEEFKIKKLKKMINLLLRKC